MTTAVPSGRSAARFHRLFYFHNYYNCGGSRELTISSARRADRKQFIKRALQFARLPLSRWWRWRQEYSCRSSPTLFPVREMSIKRIILVQGNVSNCSICHKWSSDVVVADVEIISGKPMFALESFFFGLTELPHKFICFFHCYFYDS